MRDTRHLRLEEPSESAEKIGAGFLRLPFARHVTSVLGSSLEGFTWVEARDAFAELSFVWGTSVNSSHPLPLCQSGAMPTRFGCLAC